MLPHLKKIYIRENFIYIAWKSQAQKSSITPQKSTQRDESDIERVEVPQTPQSQSMSKFNASQPKEKRHSPRVDHGFSR